MDAGDDAWVGKCNQFGLARAALELCALGQHRDGLRPGERNDLALTIAACLVASIPTGWPLDRVRAHVRSVLRLVVSEDWLRDEWEGKADASVMERYTLAGELADRKKLSRKTEPRYTYRMKTLAETWHVTDDEVLELGLLSLAGNRHDTERLRRDRGVVSRAEWLTACRTDAPRVQALLAEGYSLRAAAKETGLTIGRVRRLAVVDLASLPSAQPVTEPVAPQFLTREALDVGEVIRIYEREHARMLADAMKLELRDVLAVMSLTDDEFQATQVTGQPEAMAA
jgi:hypothetical protein